MQAQIALSCTERMFKRYSLPGTSPATLLHHPDRVGALPKIVVTDYRADGVE